MNLAQLAALVIFYGLMAILGLFSLVMIYVLLRFGKSTMLGLVVIGLYLVIMGSLYGLAIANFAALQFPNLSIW